jgi:hypothetical protein
MRDLASRYLGDESSETRKTQQREGPLARIIESQTSRLPSDLFLWGALGSIAASLFFVARGQRTMGNFIGQWVPTILILGLYNKIVKVAGSDRWERDKLED